MHLLGNQFWMDSLRARPRDKIGAAISDEPANLPVRRPPTARSPGTKATYSAAKKRGGLILVHHEVLRTDADHDLIICSVVDLI
jgi:hypothetical protein